MLRSRCFLERNGSSRMRQQRVLSPSEGTGGTARSAEQAKALMLDMILCLAWFIVGRYCLELKSKSYGTILYTLHVRTHHRGGCSAAPGSTERANCQR